MQIMNLEVFVRVRVTEIDEIDRWGGRRVVFLTAGEAANNNNDKSKQASVRTRTRTHARTHACTHAHTHTHTYKVEAGGEGGVSLAMEKREDDEID